MNDLRKILEYFADNLSMPFLKIVKKKDRIMMDMVIAQQKFGIKTLYDYMVFQLNYWHFCKWALDRFDGVIPFSWLFGNNAVKRWYNKNDHWKYFNELFCAKNGIKTEWIENETINVFDITEDERKRYFNTEEGFVHCQEFAGYSSDSQYCSKCNFKNMCK